MSAPVSFFARLFGSFSWSAPEWAQAIKRSAKARPVRFFALLLLTLALLSVLGAAGYYYLTQPKPLQVVADISPPQLGHYQDDIEQPTPLTLTFQYDFAHLERSITSGPGGDSPQGILPAPLLSVARLDLIGEVLTDGVNLRPAIEGSWQWQNENQLIFTPHKAWPAGQTYQVSLHKKLFAKDLPLASLHYEFSTQPLTARVGDLRFYQHPTQASSRQIVATLSFSHPVDIGSVQQQLSLTMRPDGASREISAQPLGFSLTSDKTGREVYVQSNPLTLTEHEQYMQLQLQSGVKARDSAAKTSQRFEDSLLVPDSGSFLKVAQLETQIVRSSEFEPEQVLLLSFTDRINRTELANRLKLYQLPKHPRRRDNRWAPGEVTASVLAQAQLLQYELMSTAEAHDNAFSVKLDLPAQQSVFVSLPKGLVSINQFSLSNEYRAVVQAPAYPKEARLVGEGAMLTLSGEQKLQLLTRGMKGLRVSLYKLLPDQLNHFISQTGGDISAPYFNNYNFDESNISARFEKTFTLAEVNAKQANYLAMSLQPYLEKAGMGMFFIELSEFDPKQPKRRYEVLQKRVVLVTDLGLLVKHNADTSQQVFVMSVATGKPVAGAKVALLGKNGVAVQSGSTDERGFVALGKTKGYSRERQPVVYLVTKQTAGRSDSSFIPFDRYSRQLDYSKFNTDGTYQAAQDSKALSAYVFSDRGIYRPGEPVQLAAVIRHSDLSLAQNGLPLKVSVQGPRGNTFWQQNFALSGRGMHTFSLDTLPSSDTGSYHASISLLDAKGRSSRHLGSVSFSLEEFQPDTLKISSRFNQQAKGWLSPADLRALVQLDNLFGTPAQQRRVSASMTLLPERFEFSQYSDYQFLTLRHDKMSSGRITQTLDEQQTDADGKASFALPLEQYSAGTYRVMVTTEGFDAGGGRSVQSVTSSLISPQRALVGFKADGELNYLKKQQGRNLQFIAIDNALQQIALTNLNLKLVEKRPQSSLVKQPDGTFQYQSIVQQVVLNEQAFAISASGSPFDLPTDTAGDFELQLYQDTQLLGAVSFTVVGAGNINAMLEQNAALTVRLDKTAYQSGDWIELNITAPYTGSGLISIESDKVHAFSWFSADTTSSVQRIRLPEGIEGNAYINVSFVRGADSDALFVSPLSYAVVPFNIDRSSRKLQISLELPKEVRPGKAFTLRYKTDRPADLVLYGVDEGILQVAGYQLPDPLSHYLQKRALQVRSMQMLDLILPEFSALQRQLAGVGGDMERKMLGMAMLDKNLNPFARRADKPGVFWLGKLSADTTLASAQVSLPASFSGNVKVMAIAVSDSALAAKSVDLKVRGPFVLTPEVLQSAAPGDEFEVSLSVANGIKGSGKAAPVTVTLTSSELVSVLGSAEQQLLIDENGEQSARFRVKAGATPGAAELTFTARYQQGESSEDASRAVSLSIRPASSFHSNIIAGYAASGTATVPLQYPLYAEFASQRAAASANPLVLAEAFSHYLEQYPHGCTEQVVSQVFPWLGLVQQPAYQAQLPALREKFALLIDKLAQRQQSDGGFSFWPGGYNSDSYPSIYAMHFLLAAREQGLVVPDYLYQQGLQYLRNVARQSGANLYQARLRATAIYLLTRSGEVTTNYLVELHDRLEKQHQQRWQTDVTAIYMAASYQLLQKPELGRPLLSGYRLGQESTLQQAYLARIAAPLPPFANPVFQSQLSLDAQYLYLVSLHFPEKAKQLKGEDIVTLLQPVLSGKYHTQDAAYTILGLSAYASVQPQAAALAPQFFQLDQTGKRQPLLLADNQSAIPLVRFNTDAAQLVIEAQQQLFYAVSQAGFMQTPPSAAIAQQLEVSRDYLNAQGKVVNRATQGEELTVRLRLRSLSDSYQHNVAVIDLLPAGFSIVRSSVPRKRGMWRADYVDVREDRLVYYASFGPTLTELSYKVKVTAAGDFILPSVSAQSMYDNSVQAATAAGRFVVSAAD